MDTKKSQNGEFENNGYEERETKKLTILVILMTTVVLAFYALIPIIK